jgi:hypothetical protein
MACPDRVDKALVLFGSGSADQEFNGVLAVAEDEDRGVLVEWWLMAHEVALEHSHRIEFCDVVAGLPQSLEAPEEAGRLAVGIIPT